ncbi:hypothetical protein IAU59_007622 [Kwoniella sp. CBS 9459]
MDSTRCSWESLTHQQHLPRTHTTGPSPPLPDVHPSAHSRLLEAFLSCQESLSFEREDKKRLQDQLTGLQLTVREHSRTIDELRDENQQLKARVKTLDQSLNHAPQALRDVRNEDFGSDIWSAAWNKFLQDPLTLEWAESQRIISNDMFDLPLVHPSPSATDTAPRSIHSDTVRGLQDRIEGIFRGFKDLYQQRRKHLAQASTPDRAQALTQARANAFAQPLYCGQIGLYPVIQSIQNLDIPHGVSDIDNVNLLPAIDSTSMALIVLQLQRSSIFLVSKKPAPSVELYGPCLISTSTELKYDGLALIDAREAFGAFWTQVQARREGHAAQHHSPKSVGGWLRRGDRGVPWVVNLIDQEVRVYDSVLWSRAQVKHLFDEILKDLLMVGVEGENVDKDPDSRIAAEEWNYVGKISYRLGADLRSNTESPDTGSRLYAYSAGWIYNILRGCLVDAKGKVETSTNYDPMYSTLSIDPSKFSLFNKSTSIDQITVPELQQLHGQLWQKVVAETQLNLDLLKCLYDQ